MDRPYIAENDSERARLEDLLARLTDEDFARPMGEHWTVGVGLIHLAFWDRMWLSKLEEWERIGFVDLPALSIVRDVNDAMLGWWRSIAPAQIRHEVLAAIRAFDEKSAALPDRIVEPILADRPRTLTRALHRRQHLDEIETALSSRG